MGVKSARLGEWLGAILLGAALVAVLTYPTVPGFLTHGRLDTGDGRFSIWNIGWVAHALVDDPLRLFHANIFHPHAGTLAYSELNLVAGVLGLPAYAATGSAIAALNAAVLAGLLAAFLTTWAFVRRLTGSSIGGLGAAAAFTFCPFVQAHTAHIQLLMTFGIPLVLLAFHGFRESPGWGRAAALGVALAVAALACGYYGIFAAGALTVMALVFVRTDWRYWAGLAAAAAVTAALVLPIYLPYREYRRMVRPESVVNMEEVRSYSATWASYMSSPSFLHESLPWHPPAAESVFPGYLLTWLAAQGLIIAMVRGTGRDRMVAAAYLGLGGLAFWASFGPDWGLYSWLLSVVPALDLLRAPVRLGIVVVLALSVLAAFALRDLATRRKSFAICLVLLLALETATLPWPLVQAPPVPEAYRALANLPRGGVVEFPFMYRRSDFLNHTRYMFTSTYHWQQLVNGYSDVTPPDFEPMAVPINAFPDEASFEIMKRLGVRYVTWNFGERGYDPVSRDKILARVAAFQPYLRLITTDRDVWLYEIVNYP